MKNDNDIVLRDKPFLINIPIEHRKMFFYYKFFYNDLHETKRNNYTMDYCL